MGLLRSEKMGYFELVVQADMAWRTLNEVGKQSSVQIIDLNAGQNVYNRRYATYIRRCDEAERRLRFISQEQERFHIEILPARNTAEVLDQIDLSLERDKCPAQTHFENLERELEGYEERILSQVKNYEQMATASSALQEKKLVLEQARNNLAFGSESRGENMFNRLAGVISNIDLDRFKRLVFRVTRGNALTTASSVGGMRDPKTEKMVEKSIFFVLYQGDEDGVLSSKLGRLCDTLGIKRYGMPNSQQQLEADYCRNQEEIRTGEDITNRTRENLQAILQKLASPKCAESRCSLIEEYRLFVVKEKTIYHSLNMFHLRNNIFYGNCWCPKSQEPSVRAVLDDFARYPGFSSGQLREIENPPANLTPPTYFKLNEFTAAFQEIVDTYGVPNYQEANPALFTIITFPYLFGIMFGDVGHGLLLLSFATYLCWNKEKLLQENGTLAGAVPARYLLLLMGLFATYNGLIYNDFLGIPLDLFGSRWSADGTRTSDGTYPFGLDPAWYIATNELIFFNSFKMKIAVVFGVVQMIIGNCFKGLNALFFRNATDFFFEFIPQIVFMTSIFGYMIVMIFIKWDTDWEHSADAAPNLISTLMNMFLKLGALGSEGPLWGDKAGQESLQFLLILIAMICVPLMLFPKPLILNYMHKKRSTEARSGERVAFQPFQDEGGKEPEFSLSEEFIHQMIETIEYVLGAVSNTASYLRLWALSLAHAQLSKVFFEKCLILTIETGNALLVVIGFFVFANITVGVLMCMDAMECFLHALRLHWVEFQNKFYKGQGVKFSPISFEQVVNDGKLK